MLSASKLASAVASLFCSAWSQADSSAMILPSSPFGFVVCRAAPKTAHTASNTSMETTAFMWRTSSARFEFEHTVILRGRQIAGTVRNGAWLVNITSSERTLHQFFDEAARHIGGHPRFETHKRALVQHRLGSVQAGHIGALEEFSYGDFFAPKERFLHRHGPVRSVVHRIVLELLQARAIPLVRIVVIVGHARAEDVEERKAFMLNALLDEFGEMLLIAAETAGHKRCARGQGQRNRVHRRLNIPEWHALRLHANAACRRSLTGGEPVNLIVHHNVQQVHVAAHGVNEMISTDAEAVAVTAGHQHS